MKEMEKRIKSMLSISFAFVTSFLLTVTAFSMTASAEAVINRNYLGKYTNDIYPGYIWATESDLSLFAYEDLNYMCFFTGSVGSYQLKLGGSGLYAFFPSVSRVTKNGEPASGTQTIFDYTVSGDVSVELNIFGIIKNVKIASHQSTVVYERQ